MYYTAIILKLKVQPGSLKFGSHRKLSLSNSDTSRPGMPKLHDLKSYAYIKLYKVPS